LTDLRKTVAVIVLAAASAAAARSAEKPQPAASPAGTVVFVCAHGAVKSLITSQWFNRRAAERGLSVRSIARGMTPDAAIADDIALGLKADGFDVAGQKPRALVTKDLGDATRIIEMGVDTSSVTAASHLPTDKWDDKPFTADRYRAVRDAERARIEALLDQLDARTPKP
jgi:arsenate reductase (thioredoxin)